MQYSDEINLTLHEKQSGLHYQTTHLKPIRQHTRHVSYLLCLISFLAHVHDPNKRVSESRTGGRISVTKPWPNALSIWAHDAHSFLLYHNRQPENIAALWLANKDPSRLRSTIQMNKTYYSANQQLYSARGWDTHLIFQPDCAAQQLIATIQG